MRILVIALALSLVGCATSGAFNERAKELDALMAGHVGTRVDDVIRDWGPPAREAPDGHGGRVLTWVRDFKPDALVDVASGGKRSERIFYVDAKGRIYRGEWIGIE